MTEVPYGSDPASPTLYDDAPALRAFTSDELDEPADFDEFWRATLDEVRRHPAQLRSSPVDTGLRSVVVEDATVTGWGGQPVRGWLILPAENTAANERAEPLPLVVQFCGYGGGRGVPLEHLAWASAGYAHFVMDSRGQGSTPDLHQPASGPDGSHVLRGICSPETYYYRRLIADAARAVDCLQLDPRISPVDAIVTGVSQGGGLALAVAALVPAIGLLLCDIPFMCHWRRALQIADRGPYAEVTQYCAAHPGQAASALATLRYFDGVSFAARARAPATFSVALRDRVCPPSTVLAAYDSYAGTEKKLIVHPHNDHEGGGLHQVALNLASAGRRRGSLSRPAANPPAANPPAS